MNKFIFKENYTEDAPGEYTMWSASDLVDSNEHIPLVKVKTDDDGKLYAVALGNSPFDQESYEIAVKSIESTQKAGKSHKDILTRLDKTLNHNDPYFSVEFDRSKSGILNIGGTDLLAAQALVTLRDDLKAASNMKDVDEADLVNKFIELTGVDYYTDKIVDRPQYDMILALLSKDPKDYHNYIYPKDNKYIQSLKDLLESLIEKVNDKNGEIDNETLQSKLKNVKDTVIHDEKTGVFYRNYDKNTNKELENLSKEIGKLSEIAEDEEEVVNLFKELTGVDYYTEKVVDKDKYLEILDKIFYKEPDFKDPDNSKIDIRSFELPEDNKLIQKLKDFTEDVIEKVLLRIDPDFYN